MSLNTTPLTWTASHLVTVTDLNTEIRDAFTGIQAAWTTDGRASTTIWTGSTTNPAIGNGTLVSRYRQIGKTLDWDVLITMGSSTTFGSGAFQLTLPFTAAAMYRARIVGRAYDASVSTTRGFPVKGDLTSTTLVQLRTDATSALGNADRDLSSANPFTWTTSDVLYVGITCELA